MLVYGRVPDEGSHLADESNEELQNAFEEGRPAPGPGNVEEDDAYLRYEKPDPLIAEAKELHQQAKKLSKEKNIDNQDNGSYVVLYNQYDKR